MGILLSLSAALFWGIADFFAAASARRIGSVRTQLISQCLELTVIAAILAWRGTLWAATPTIWGLSLALGAFQCIGLLLLYRSFQIGTLSIVAPVASSFVIFAAFFAWLGGERLAPLALCGAALLFAGVVLVTQSPANGSAQGVSAQGDSTRASTAGVWEALAAALAISLVFWQFGALAERSARLWPLLPLRICSLAGSGLVLVFTRPAVPSQTAPPQPAWPLWLLIVIVATTNCFAWISFDAALQATFTTLVAAVSSLFSAVTIFMAWFFFKERLAVIQWVGVVVILFGVLLVGL